MGFRPSTVTAHGTERRKVPVREGQWIPSEMSGEMGEKRMIQVIQYFAPHRPRWPPFTEDEDPEAAFLAGPYMLLSTHYSHIRMKDSSWSPQTARSLRVLEGTFMERKANFHGC